MTDQPWLERIPIPHDYKAEDLNEIRHEMVQLNNHAIEIVDLLSSLKELLTVVAKKLS